MGWTRYEGEKSGEEKSRRAVAGVPVAAALLRFIADFLDEHGWILAVRANGERNAQNWQSTDSQGAVENFFLAAAFEKHFASVQYQRALSDGGKVGLDFIFFDRGVGGDYFFQ